MSQINLSDYELIEVDDANFKFEVNDIIFHEKSKKIELIINETTDLIQEEVYPLVLNFGCSVYRKSHIVG